MIRKIVTALILIPIAVGFAALAVANRQTVVISLDPFDHAAPALVGRDPAVRAGPGAADLRRGGGRHRRLGAAVEVAAQGPGSPKHRRATCGPRSTASSGASDRPNWSAETLPGGFTPQLTIRPPAA